MAEAASWRHGCLFSLLFAGSWVSKLAQHSKVHKFFARMIKTGKKIQFLIILYPFPVFLLICENIMRFLLITLLDRIPFSTSCTDRQTSLLSKLSCTSSCPADDTGSLLSLTTYHLLTILSKNLSIYFSR